MMLQSLDFAKCDVNKVKGAKGKSFYKIRRSKKCEKHYGLVFIFICTKK